MRRRTRQGRRRVTPSSSDHRDREWLDIVDTLYAPIRNGHDVVEMRISTNIGPGFDTKSESGDSEIFKCLNEVAPPTECHADGAEVWR